MTSTEKEANQEGTTYNQLEIQQSNFIGNYASTLITVTILKGVLFFAWFVIHTYTTYSYQNDDSTEWTQLCKWKYLDQFTPIKELPQLQSMKGGP